MRRFLFWLLLGLPLGAFGQSLGAGQVLGPFEGETAPWARWAAFEAPPVRGGVVDYSVPKGETFFSWKAFSSRLAWAGWTLGEGAWSTALSAGALVPGTLSLVWEAYPFQACFDRGEFFGVGHRWGPWTLGGGAVETKGGLRSSGFDLGTFDGQGWVLWAGWEGFGAFWGRADGRFRALYQLPLLWSVDGRGSASAQAGGLTFTASASLGPGTWSGTGAVGGAEVRAEADLRWSVLANLFHIPVLYDGYRASGAFSGRAAGLGADQQWKSGPWTLGLGIGAGLLWTDGSPWTRRRDWTAQVQKTGLFGIPYTVDEPRTSQTVWNVVSDPAWVVVLRPRAAWEPVRGWSLEVSRWLPFAGGFSFGEVPAAGASSGGPGARGGSASDLGETWKNLSWQNRWLAGTEVRLTASY